MKEGKEGEYIAVVLNEDKRKVSFYSSRNPITNIKSNEAVDDCKDIYYACFGDLENFLAGK
jgi:hypothetical protein